MDRTILATGSGVSRKRSEKSKRGGSITIPPARTAAWAGLRIAPSLGASRRKVSTSLCYLYVFTSWHETGSLRKQETNERIKRQRGMKWVEIISIRSSTHSKIPFVDELLKGISESDLPTDTPEHLVEIRVYHHSIVETDLSMHIYWESEPGSQDKSPLGLRFYSALKPLGLLNHSVWVETAAREFVAQD